MSMEDAKMSHPETLDRIRTADTISMSPEMFEKLYLNPPNRVKGDLRQTFGNPTPVGLGAFLLVLTPLSMVLLGWQGTQNPPGNLGAANIGSYVVLGGFILILAAIGEFILGNHFPMVVFALYGGFLLSLGITVWPYSGAVSSYATDATNPASGLTNPQFYNTFAFFLLCMAILSLIFMIVALRTNVVFFGIFLFLVPTFCLLASTFWQTFDAPGVASQCQKAAGALAFVVSLLGWYIFASIMLALVDFPVQLPIGDLSQVVKGGSQRAMAKSAV